MSKIIKKSVILFRLIEYIEIVIFMFQGLRRCPSVEPRRAQCCLLADYIYLRNRDKP